MSLTDRQEQFVQALLEGKSQREAYRQAYPNSRKWKDKNVDSQASKTFKIPKVFTRYNELKNKIEEEHKAKVLWNKEKASMMLMWLMQQSQFDIKEKGIRQANSTAFLNAIKELNDLEAVGTKEELQVQKLQKELNNNDKTEDKLKDYFLALSEEVANSE